MKNKEIYKKALTLALPMMVQNGITNAVGLVDNLMVGSLGTESMTAVSIAVQLIFVFNLAIFGGLSGPGIYCAQYYGHGDKDGFRNVVRLKIWVGIFALVAGILAFTFLGPQLIGLYIHGTDPSVDGVLTKSLGLSYIHIMTLGFIPFVITQIYSGSLRETGQAVVPMISGIVSVVVDIVFNYLLIFGKFGFPCLGVQGAAVATVLARLAEMSTLVIWTMRKIDRYPFLQGVLTTLRIPISSMSTIVKKSLPMFANEFLWAGSVAAISQCYSIRGLSVIAGMNISNAICNLMMVVFLTMGNATGIIAGQYLGASEFEKAKEGAMKLMWFTGFISAIAAVVLIALSGVFPLFYDTTAEVRTLGRNFIILNALFFPLQGFLNALYFTLRSGGKTLITFFYDSIYSWIVAVTLSFLLCNFTDWNVLVIFAIVQSADLLKVLIGYYLIRKGIWITNLVA